MITATTTTRDGKELIILGLTAENFTRLMKGQPVFIDARNHPGFPEAIAIAIVFGPTERELTEHLKPLIDPDHTKIITIPREKGEVS